MPNLKPFIEACREAGVDYQAAYSAWLHRRLEVTAIPFGKRKFLYLDAEQAKAFSAWAERFGEADAA